MKKIIQISPFCLAALAIAGCGTTTSTTTTSYDAEGKVIQTVEVQSDVSDFTAYMQSGDGCATTLSADVSKFNIGWNGYGINWFSVSGVRVKAPKGTANELDSTAGVISATKASIQTDDFGINTDKAAEQKTTESK